MTRRGVIGVSLTSAPIALRASRTALAMAAGGATAPPSPMPFNAVFGVRCRRVQIADLDCRHLGSAGHQIIGQCAGQRLAGFVIRDFLEQGSSDALDDEQQIDNRASLAGC